MPCEQTLAFKLAPLTFDVVEAMEQLYPLVESLSESPSLEKAWISLHGFRNRKSEAYEHWRGHITRRSKPVQHSEIVAC